MLDLLSSGKLGTEVCVVALSGSSSSSSMMGSNLASWSASSSSSSREELGLVVWLGPDDSLDPLPDPFGGAGSG